NPNLRDEEIATEFQCDRSTITKIFKQKQWSDARKVSKNANALKITGPKFPQIEQALGMWIGTAEQRQLILTGEVIRQKALEFATALGVPEKAESAPVEFLEQFREELKDVLKLYEPQDIFNTDECGLFYCMEPDTSLLTSVRKGKKKNKSRNTVVCMSNADGTEKIKPLVINKFRMPLAFRYEGITSYNQLPVNYDYNEKAWMRQNIFKAIFRIQERRILLLVDNATSHTPMDAGIINTFKAHYKRLYINQVIHDFDRGVEEPSKIDILQAIRLVKAAWEAISTETLKNCWRHTGILPHQHLVKIFSRLEPAPNEDPEAQIIQIPDIITAQHEAQEVIDLTEDANLQQLTQDYLDDNKSIKTKEVLDDERIIEFVKNPVVNEDKSDDQVDEEPKITFAEAKSSLNQLLTFIRQQSFQTDNFIKENDETFFYDFLSRTHRASTKFMKQSTLEHLIIHEQT
ncbi:1230_t:CDS:2, partial [Gigaspora rosea]